MRKKRIGILFGMEDTFPWALIDAINQRGGDDVEAGPVEISYIKDDGVFQDDLIAPTCLERLMALAGDPPVLVTCRRDFIFDESVNEQKYR